ncbi:hypothetical protein GYMLUDRAFT_151343 [Collybiopsis luxurians FD-317 M1]|nr:hypothetical protein GYMLUDRAFT_151343 [Collybiopsis luxurians FD-317 M1]
MLLDIYFSSSVIRQKLTNDDLTLGCLVYFHGGGLTVGNRKSWFPKWLQQRITDAGHVFISPDYRLMPSGSTTGHDILEDIQHAFRFISKLSLDIITEESGTPESNPASAKSISLHIDPDRIVAGGSSAGGLCAYLAAMHAKPKPKAILSMYGMGGNFLIPLYYTLKHTIFLRGREMLDPSLFSEFLYPACVSEDSTAVADSPNTYFPPNAPADTIGKPGSLTNSGPPGFPSNRRMFLSRLYLQLGEFLDYYTGEHQPSLSATLRIQAKDPDSVPSNSSKPEASQDSLAYIIPGKHRHLFPSLCSSVEYASWPPVYFFHGSMDSAVPVQETRHLHDLLTKAGVQSVITIAEGSEHSFDYEPTAEDVHKEEFDKIVIWLDGFLHKT